MQKQVSIFWFRRDLRLEDNVGLWHALQGKVPVLPIFIFDPDILEHLAKDDARVNFIHQAVVQLHTILHQQYGSGVCILHASPIAAFETLLEAYSIHTVYTNRDYEPYARERDSNVANFLFTQGINFKTFKDQVIFEKNEITKENGDPYVVYTPYMRKWKAAFAARKPGSLEPKSLRFNFYKTNTLNPPSLTDIGFIPSSIAIPSYTLTSDFIAAYGIHRNFPANTKGTSKLGIHLRFGTVSIRRSIQMAILEDDDTFWSELIWREFFMQILWHFPHTVHRAFKPKYDHIVWRNDLVEFEQWKNGETGYALVDAGMRELKATGYMHNRVRMLVASFLCKHLLIDWRWGEAYFAEKLLDYELSSNVGNWQWAAGSGVDAAPYFRIFNPTTQAEKFDKQQQYILTWVPEFHELSYPAPIVDHKIARNRCLEAYKAALQV